MSKRTTLTDKPVPIRIDAATNTNIESIIESGLAADRSAAFRAATAITVRLMADDPYIYATIGADGLRAEQIFGSQSAAENWLHSIGAVFIADIAEWSIRDEDGDEEAWYRIEKILPR